MDKWNKAAPEAAACSGKTGIALDACKFKEKAIGAVNAYEKSTGIFLNEGRADAVTAGGRIIIKGDGVKYKYGF